MRRRHSGLASDEAIAIRFAWWTAFFATLTVIAVLGLVRSAQALTVPPTASATPLTFPVAAEEEDEAEASEDEGFEDEECEIDEEECEIDDSTSAAPQECLLTSTQATISVTPNKDRVRLQVNYTTSESIEASVAYGLHGSKGSLYLGGEKERFARQGVLRLTKTLTETQMQKAVAAKGFTVRLRVPEAPGYCQSFFDQQLDVRQATPSGLSWQAAE